MRGKFKTQTNRAAAAVPQIDGRRSFFEVSRTLSLSLGRPILDPRTTTHTHTQKRARTTKESIHHPQNKNTRAQDQQINDDRNNLTCRRWRISYCSPTTGFSTSIHYHRGLISKLKARRQMFSTVRGFNQRRVPWSYYCRLYRSFPLCKELNETTPSRSAEEVVSSLLLTETARQV